MPKSDPSAKKANNNNVATSKEKNKKRQEPKSVLDKIIYAIRQQPPGPNGSVSRTNIVKYLKSEFDYDKSTQIKLALKRGMSNGTLLQTGQSFSVKGDPPRSVVEEGEPLQIIDDDKHKGKNDGGKVAARGDTVTVQYQGRLDDGTQFDAAKSFTVVLGAGDVIKGWDTGLVGMAVGAKRKLIVPSRLGYGKRGCAPDIPPNATLNFSITMKKIVPT